MKIYVKTLTGLHFELNVEPRDTIQSIQLKIQDELKIPIEEQRLIYAGNQLQPNKTVSHYSIQKVNTCRELFSVFRTVFCTWFGSTQIKSPRQHHQPSPFQLRLQNQDQ